MSSQYSKYKKTSVLSASREQILLMLYEGAIRFTKLAIQAIEQNKVAEKGQNIIRAFDIVLELHATLDHKVGGELAIQLEQLYVFMMDKYTQANLKNDAEALRANLKVLGNLYDGWKQAIDKLKKENEQKGGAA